MLSAGAGGAKGRKGYPSAGVVGTGSMAETAFNLGLDGRDGRAELRPRRKVRGDILSAKHDVSPGRGHWGMFQNTLV